MLQTLIFILELKETILELQVIYLVDKTLDNLGQDQLLILMEEAPLQIQ
jgi:hypothetical protein